MGVQQLTVRIVVSNKRQEQVFLVTLREPGRIKQFRRILDTGLRQKAMVFALANGRMPKPNETSGPAQLTLTKDGAFWDLLS